MISVVLGALWGFSVILAWKSGFDDGRKVSYESAKGLPPNEYKPEELVRALNGAKQDKPTPTDDDYYNKVD